MTVNLSKSQQLAIKVQSSVNLQVTIKVSQLCFRNCKQCLPLDESGQTQSEGFQASLAWYWVAAPKLFQVCFPCFKPVNPPSLPCTWQSLVQNGIRSSCEGKEMCALFFFSFLPWWENRFKCKVSTRGGFWIRNCLVASQKAIFGSGSFAFPESDRHNNETESQHYYNAWCRDLAVCYFTNSHTSHA